MDLSNFTINISSLSSQNLVSQKFEILEGKEFSYRLSQFFVYDREIQEINNESNHLSCRFKHFSLVIKIHR